MFTTMRTRIRKVGRRRYLIIPKSYLRAIKADERTAFVVTVCGAKAIFTPVQVPVREGARKKRRGEVGA